MLAELLELVPAGVEEVDRGDRRSSTRSTARRASCRRCRRCARRPGAALVDVTTTEVADDWSSRWRSFHKPVTIGERLHVRPPWARSHRSRAACSTSRSIPRRRSAPARTTRRGCASRRCSRSRAPAGVGRAASTSAAARASSRSRRASSAGTRCCGLDHERDVGRRDARQRGRQRGARCRSRTCDLLRDGPATVARRSSSRTSCARCSCTSRARASPASRRACSSPAACCAHEADEVAAAFAREQGLHERERRHGGEWAALTLVATDVRRARDATHSGRVAFI